MKAQIPEYITVNKSIFYKTTSIFSEIEKKEIILRFIAEDIPPQTKKGIIFLPIVKIPPLIKDEDDLYTALEKELAHQVFGTDYVKAEKWAKEKYKAMWELGYAVWKILEDQRVESLWGKLYKGSLFRFKVRREFLLANQATNIIEVFLAARGKRYDLIPEELQEQVIYFEKYLQKVELSGPLASFLITEKIMKAIVDSSEISRKIEKGQMKAGSFELELKSIEKIDESQLEDEIKDIKNLLEQAKNEGLDKINEISQALSKIEKVTRKNKYQTGVCESEKTSSDPIREDITTGKKLSQLLRTIIFKRIYDPDNEGLELDIDEYLQWKINPRYERKLFSDDEKEHEFTCIVLLDLSLSMNPRYGSYSDSYSAVGFTTKLGLAKRAATVLSLAFKGIESVKFKVYGFSGSSEDLIVLVKEAENILDIQKLDCTPGWALSPLHLAVNVITENLRNVSGRKLLFIITDGYPEASLYGKAIDKDWLIKWTRESVRNSLEKGVQVFTIMIDPQISDEEMHTMFGSSERWTILRDQEKLREVMLKYVGKKVARLIQKGM
jgi:hypothetical protein